MDFNPAVIALWILPFLMAVVFHEWAHGYVAKRFGDDTASSLGRLSLNPLVHIDPVGTLALPAFLMLTGSPVLFGWAKPVPITYERLRNPRRDMVLVALAGPGMNLLLAVLSAAALAAITKSGVGSSVGTGEAAASGMRIVEPLAIMCTMSLQLNVVLAIFNLLPIPPLDGGRVAVGLLPHQAAEAVARIEPYGFLIILALLATRTLDYILGPMARAVLDLIAGVFLR